MCIKLLCFFASSHHRRTMQCEPREYGFFRVGHLGGGGAMLDPRVWRIRQISEVFGGVFAFGCCRWFLFEMQFLVNSQWMDFEMVAFLKKKSCFVKKNYFFRFFVNLSVIERWVGIKSIFRYIASVESMFQSKCISVRTYC